MEVGSFQSILQFLAAIYLVVEWVNVDKIVSHYKNRQKLEVGYRLRRFKKYDNDLEGLSQELADESNPFMSTHELYGNFSVFKKMCFFYFFLCFIGLAVTSFYSVEVVPKLAMLLVLLFLCLPFAYVFFKIIIPAHNEYKLTKQLVEDILSPFEQKAAEFEKCNAYPQVRTAVKKMRDGDKSAMKVYYQQTKKYRKDYDNFMQNSL